MSIYYRDDLIIVSNQDTDIEFAEYYNLKKMNLNKSYKKEEHLLYQIISSAELILDELNNGSEITDRNLDQIKLADSILLDIEQELTAKNKPSHLK